MQIRPFAVFVVVVVVFLTKNFLKSDWWRRWMIDTGRFRNVRDTEKKKGPKKQKSKERMILPRSR